MRSLHLRQIEAFHAAVTMGGVTAAADHLGISQPAASRLLKDLEASVGFQLFERHKGRLAPTAEALAFFEEVDRSFVGLEHMARVARQIGQRRSAHLRIAVMPAFAHGCLATVVRRFLARHPDVTLQVHTLGSALILQGVMQRHYDIGVIGIPGDQAGVRVARQLEGPAFLALPAGHRLAGAGRLEVTDLSGSLLALGHTSPLRKRLEADLRQAGVELDHPIEAPLSSILYGFAAEGIGMAVIDPLTALAHADPRVALALLTPEVPYEIAVIEPTASPSSPMARAFLAEIEGVMTDPSRWPRLGSGKPAPGGIRVVA